MDAAESQFDAVVGVRRGRLGVDLLRAELDDGRLKSSLAAFWSQRRGGRPAGISTDELLDTMVAGTRRRWLTPTRSMLKYWHIRPDFCDHVVTSSKTLVVHLWPAGGRHPWVERACDDERRTACGKPILARHEPYNAPRGFWRQPNPAYERCEGCAPHAGRFEECAESAVYPLWDLAHAERFERRLRESVADWLDRALAGLTVPTAQRAAAAGNRAWASAVHATAAEAADTGGEVFCERLLERDCQHLPDGMRARHLSWSGNSTADRPDLLSEHFDLAVWRELLTGPVERFMRVNLGLPLVQFKDTHRPWSLRSKQRPLETMAIDHLIMLDNARLHTEQD